METFFAALAPWLIVPGVLVMMALFAFMYKAYEKFMEWLDEW